MKYFLIIAMFFSFACFAKDPNVLAKKVQIENLEADYYVAKAKKAEAINKLRDANKKGNNKLSASEIRLVGVESFGDKKSAYLELHKAINEYYIGDWIGSNYKLVSINRNSVVVKYNNSLINLSFSNSEDK